MAGTKLLNLYAGLLLLSRPVWSLDINSTDGIVETSKTLAQDLMEYYKGNETGQTPGLLVSKDKDDEYYWYESGIFMSTLVNYWQLTGDDTYNDLVTQGLIHQGQNGFLPNNQTLSAGNDEQAVWASAALTAAEYGFPEGSSKETQWLDLAVEVFEQQRRRWDTEKEGGPEDSACNGGLRWTISVTSAGFNFKQTTANAHFFNLCSRLAIVTGNGTYADYADETWNWLQGVGMIDDKTWAVYQGASVQYNCTDTNKVTTSGDSALVVAGAAYMYSYAYMYNYTEGSSVWKSRVEKLSDSVATTFFPNGTLAEVSCDQETTKCPSDFLALQPIVYRSLSVTTKAAPFTAEQLQPLLKKSAESVISEKFKVEQKPSAITGLIKLSAVLNLLISHAEMSPVVETGNQTTGDNGTETESSDSVESSVEVTKSAATKTAFSLLSISISVAACMYLI